jgi:hypothetical protein
MNKYENGKIYKIVNDDIPDKVYYGSTIKKLYKRFSGHKYESKIKNKTITSKELFEKGEPRIELVEEYPCSSRKELEVRERYYIENNKCVNKTIPTRTDEEYFKSHREEAKLNSHRYREKHKERINEKQKEKFNCECGGKYTYSSKARHKKTKKHLEFENKIDI